MGIHEAFTFQATLGVQCLYDGSLNWTNRKLSAKHSPWSWKPVATVKKSPPHRCQDAHRDVLLAFNGLMHAIRPTPSFQNTTSEGVDNRDLAISNDVLLTQEGRKIEVIWHAHAQQRVGRELEEFQVDVVAYGYDSSIHESTFWSTHQANPSPRPAGRAPWPSRHSKRTKSMPPEARPACWNYGHGHCMAGCQRSLCDVSTDSSMLFFSQMWL